MFRKTLAMLTLLVGLASCGFTPQSDALRNALMTYGPQAMDALLENAEWLLCRAASVDSVRRRYGKSADLAEAYDTVCFGNSDVRIIEFQE